MAGCVAIETQGIDDVSVYADHWFNVPSVWPVRSARPPVTITVILTSSNSLLYQYDSAPTIGGGFVRTCADQKLVYGADYGEVLVSS